MAGRIQGITVEIGGDTTKLQTALKGVNTEIRNTQSQLRDVDRLLKLDPGNTELLAQKHRLLGDAVKETRDKLETLKTAAEQAEEALKEGTITQEQYDGLQREIAETEAKLRSLEEQAKQSDIKALWNAVLAAVKTAMTKVFAAVKSGFGRVKEHITGLASKSYGWGRDLIMGIVRGIRACIGEVGKAVSAVAEKIRSYLHFSVPDEGPLTDYESWMPDFIRGLAKGIENSRGLVSRAMDSITADMVISPKLMAAEGAYGNGGGAESSDISAGRFANYLSRAAAKYGEKKTFLYETRRPFYDFFVCSDILRRKKMPAHRMRKHGLADRPITDASIEKIARYNRFVILSGSGGLGKSMMMNHLMLECIRTSRMTGRVPVLANIRDFDPERGDLVDFLYDEFSRHDPGLELGDMTGLLASGKLAVLLDGLDEVNGGCRDDFVKEMNHLVDSYPECVYILASRPIMSLHSLERFSVYDLMLMRKEQAVSMVSRIDSNVIAADIRESFAKAIMENRFRLRENEKADYLGNPLLLTIMLLTYSDTKNIPEQGYKFYENAYAALARRHDETKNLKRGFATGLETDRFKYYLSELCAMTYEKCMYEFSHEEMETLVREVIRLNELDVEMQDFVDDVTGKLFVIREEGDHYEFVHRSVQEYFTAYYMSKQLERKSGAVMDILMDDFVTDSESAVLPMLHAMDTRKTEMRIFLPYLRGIFEERESRSGYMRFLMELYPWFNIAYGGAAGKQNDGSVSTIYRCFADIYDLHREIVIDGDSLPWAEYDGPRIELEWIDEGRAAANEASAEDDNAPGEGKAAVRTSRLVSVDVEMLLESPEQNELLEIIMDDSFPLKREYVAAKKKYEELKAVYAKRKQRKDWAERFH